MRGKKPSHDFIGSYYMNQVKKGGLLLAFHGQRVHRGYGLGGFFARLAKHALPIVKSGVKSVTNQLEKRV